MLYLLFFWETFSQLRNQFREKERRGRRRTQTAKERDSVSFCFFASINGWTIRSYTIDAFSCSTNPSLSMEAPSRFSIFLFQRRTSTGLQFPNQNPNFTSFLIRKIGILSSIMNKSPGSSERNRGSCHRYSPHASTTSCIWS